MKNKQNYTWQWLQPSASMQLSQTIMQVSFWFIPPRWLLPHQKVDNLQCWVQSEKLEQNVQDSKETKSSKITLRIDTELFFQRQINYEQSQGQ